MSTIFFVALAVLVVRCVVVMVLQFVLVMVLVWEY
jgi:hypothetical protein